MLVLALVMMRKQVIGSGGVVVVWSSSSNGGSCRGGRWKIMRHTIGAICGEKVGAAGYLGRSDGSFRLHQSMGMLKPQLRLDLVTTTTTDASVTNNHSFNV